MGEKRKYYIDVIKIICIWIVCFIHTGPSGVSLYYTSAGWPQVVLATISIGCTVVVLLFFMCTGALLLSKDESIVQLWKKRVIRYIIITIIFTLIYYICVSLRNHTAIDIIFILKTMYNTWGYSHSGSYWFLYSYIGFLVLLPLLRLVAKGLNKDMMRYIIMVNTVVCGVLPILESCLGMQDLGITMLLITEDVFFYPFLGYYIENHDFKEIYTRKNMLIFGGMTILSLVTSVTFTLKYIKLGIFTQEYVALFRIYVALFVYVVVKKIGESIQLNQSVINGIGEIGRCTFGIYLIHGLVYVLVDDFLILRGIHFTYELAWIRCTSVFAISLVIVWLCRKIPIIKKLF
ncbi:MAG: acyltransferase [Agathobacter sp.]|nr:acyltransferase [Agathobacter sp.]